jgi:glycosyltransferase involved in cell wall biosynthesis
VVTVPQVAILVPVLNRPHQVARLLDSIEAATPEPHRVLFLATYGDDDEISAIAAAGAQVWLLNEPGTYVRKINAGFAVCDEDVFFAAADDLAFHPGWYPAALAKLTGRCEVVGTNDLGNRRVQAGRHATHNLFTRRYIEQRGGTVDGPGLVLHEGYHHWYCDDEFVETARHRGVWRFARSSVVEHLHPLFGKGDMDDTYTLGREHNAEDRVRYRERRHLWMRERAA